MSSSYRLQRRASEEAWDFGSPADHYVLPQGECHPDFVAHEIGRPGGVKVCVRRQKPEVKKPEVKSPLVYTRSPFGDQAFRAPQRTFNLYSPGELPTQLENPYRLNDRRMTNELYALETNLYRKQVKYNGTGIPGHGSPRMLASGPPPNGYTEYTLRGSSSVLEGRGYDVTRGIQAQVYSSTEGDVSGHGMKRAFIGNLAT